MRVLAVFALLVVGLAPAAAQGGLRPMGGPVLVADAPAGADGAVVEFRYGFWLSEPADAYVVNNPAPSNAAYRAGWRTEVFLHDGDGVRLLGGLEGDHPLEVGDLDALQSYGLAFRVHVPAADLVTGTLDLTYVVALHAPACNCSSSGARLDSSVGAYLRVNVAEGATQAPLGPWDLAAVPSRHDAPMVGSEGQAGPSPWRLVAAGSAAALVAFVAILGLRRRRRNEPEAPDLA